MTRQKKKFQPGKELKEVFDAVDQRRNSARAQFIARKEGLKARDKRKELLKAEKADKATAAENTPRKNRLKQDPAAVSEKAKAIMESTGAK